MNHLWTVLIFAAVNAVAANIACAELRAGAAIVDVTPSKYPVLVNGGMTSRTADSAVTPINARAIVLDDGDVRIGIVVVDSCMMPRPLLDEAKQLAVQQTGLRHDHILISATHTHTAPASMSCLGTDADADYLPVLRAGIVEALVRAESHLEPARVGWAVENAAEFTALRRWIRRPDRLALDPFGNPTVRANMHSGSNWDDVTGESGPEDPDLSMISFQSLDGRPIALLANFSMHYFSGQKPLAADYFGLFCDGLQQQLSKGGDDHPPFVGIMSHGCSGDIWRRDYKLPPEERDPFKTIDVYADGLLKIALKAYQSIEYDTSADLAMAEARLNLDYRVPDEQRLQWARRIDTETGDRLPKTQEEVYAREQIILYERQNTEIVVQALRIGNMAIASTPNETYALTGLKMKLQSPLARTMVIELANGGDGYIPPPEQHLLGGYNTWPARSAGLEVAAEPKITETALQLLETVAQAPRKTWVQSRGPAARIIEESRPVAWFRLDEMAGNWALDSSGNDRHAIYDPAVAFFLDGPNSALFAADGETNRAAHFAGGRLRTPAGRIGSTYSVSMWIWNGMPVEGRDVAGWMFSRGTDHAVGADSERLGLGGIGSSPGRLILQQGTPSQRLTAGETAVERWTWNHVALVRSPRAFHVYLNGRLDISMPATVRSTPILSHMFFAGREDNESNWEGRLDEIAVFDRELSESEIKSLSGL